MDLTPVAIVALLVGGLFAGVVNAMAGGGSLVTLPLLVFAGLPPVVANGTNRVAVLAQSVTAGWGFGRSGHLPYGLTIRLAPITLLGAGAGAVVASRLPNEVFRPILGVLLIAMALLILVRPSRWLVERAVPPHPGLKSHLLFLAIGFYGGFIQAGIGFFILAALVLGLGLDLVRSNGVKVGLTLLLTVVALAIFVHAGQVDWVAGAVLAAGNAVGGYVGARLAVAKGAPWIRWVLVVMVIASALQILGVFEAVGRLMSGS